MTFLYAITLHLLTFLYEITLHLLYFLYEITLHLYFLYQITLHLRSFLYEITMHLLSFLYEITLHLLSFLYEITLHLLYLLCGITLNLFCFVLSFFYNGSAAVPSVCPVYWKCICTFCLPVQDCKLHILLFYCMEMDLQLLGMYLQLFCLFCGTYCDIDCTFSLLRAGMQLHINFV